jgi:hypothetical protein
MQRMMSDGKIRYKVQGTRLKVQRPNVKTLNLEADVIPWARRALMSADRKEPRSGKCAASL